MPATIITKKTIDIVIEIIFFINGSLKNLYAKIRLFFLFNSQNIYMGRLQMLGYNFENISSDPLARVPERMLSLLQKENVFFDVHCHMFNFRDVPDRFLRIRLPFNRIFLAKAERYLHGIIRTREHDPYSNLAWFINYFKNSSPSDLVNRLMDDYYGMNVILCPLMIDMTQSISGSIIDDYNVQIEKMKALRNLMPERLLPFFAADPNNPGMIENFIRVFSSSDDYKFFGLKIYPSLGYLPSHPDLMMLYGICEKKRIPVTTHCGGATVHASAQFIEGIKGYHLLPDSSFTDIEINKTFKRKKEYAVFFNHPHNWIPVLEKYPGLRLNLAHFGGETEWEKFMNGTKNNWVSLIIEMAERYHGLFTDFSYTLNNMKFTKTLKGILGKNENLAGRVLFGSDYYMVIIEGGFSKTIGSFRSEMGEMTMKKIARKNPMRFLFDRTE